MSLHPKTLHRLGFVLRFCGSNVAQIQLFNSLEIRCIPTRAKQFPLIISTCALAEPCRKIAAAETDARQLNAVRLNLYRRRRELYISLGYSRVLLTAAVPETATGYVVFGAAVLSHFLAKARLGWFGGGVPDLLQFWSGAPSRPGTTVVRPGVLANASGLACSKWRAALFSGGSQLGTFKPFAGSNG
jgi:hypothetical protein